FYTALALFRAGCPDAKFRDGKKALEAAQKAYEMTKGPSEMAALAAACAELGQFDRAVEWQTKAAAEATAEEKEQYRARLKQYQDRKPYRLEYDRIAVNCIRLPASPKRREGLEAHGATSTN